MQNRSDCHIFTIAVSHHIPPKTGHRCRENLLSTFGKVFFESSMCLCMLQVWNYKLCPNTSKEHVPKVERESLSVLRRKASWDRSICDRFYWWIRVGRTVGGQENYYNKGRLLVFGPCPNPQKSMKVIPIKSLGQWYWMLQRSPEESQ